MKDDRIKVTNQTIEVTVPGVRIYTRPDHKKQAIAAGVLTQGTWYRSDKLAEVDNKLRVYLKGLLVCPPGLSEMTPVQMVDELIRLHKNQQQLCERLQHKAKEAEKETKRVQHLLDAERAAREKDHALQNHALQNETLEKNRVSYELRNTRDQLSRTEKYLEAANRQAGDWKTRYNTLCGATQRLLAAHAEVQVAMTVQLPVDIEPMEVPA